MTYNPSRLRTIALIACQALLFSLFGLIPAARAQFSGIATVGPLSFTTSTCNGMIQAFQVPDQGQSVHFVNYLATGAPATLRVYMVASSVSNFPPISDMGTDPSGGIITANGYYHSVTIDVTCTGGSSPVVSLTYFGTSANSVPTTGSQDQSAWFKPVVAGAVENTTQNFPTLTSPYGNSCGQLFFVPNQGSNSGTLTVSTTGLAGQTVATYTIPSAFSASIFNVPCQPSQGIQVGFTVGSTNTGTYQLYYAFYKPGLFPNLTTPNSGTSSTLPIQVVSDELSQAFGASTSITNPTAAQNLLAVNANNGSRTIYFDKAIIGSTVAVSISIFPMGSCTSCTTQNNIVNLKAGSGVTSTAANQLGSPASLGTSGIGCFIPANGTCTIDLRGFIAPQGTTAGITIESSAVTGVVSPWLQWYER